MSASESLQKLDSLVSIVSSLDPFSTKKKRIERQVCHLQHHEIEEQGMFLSKSDPIGQFPIFSNSIAQLGET